MPKSKVPDSPPPERRIRLSEVEGALVLEVSIQIQREVEALERQARQIASSRGPRCASVFRAHGVEGKDVRLDILQPEEGAPEGTPPVVELVLTEDRPEVLSRLADAERKRVERGQRKAKAGGSPVLVVPINPPTEKTG